jgi:hypothetical protein
VRANQRRLLYFFVTGLLGTLPSHSASAREAFVLAPAQLGSKALHHLSASAALSAISTKQPHLQKLSLRPTQQAGGAQSPMPEDFARFEQTFRGMRVLGTGAVIEKRADGSLRWQGNLATEAELLGLGSTFADPRGAAAMGAGLTRASKWYGASSELCVVRSPSGKFVRAFRVSGLTKARGARRLSQPERFVDAATGERLFERETLRFLDETMMFETNPTKSPMLTRLALPLATKAPEAGMPRWLSNDFLDTKNCIDEGKILRFDFGGFPINTHVCSTISKAPADADGNFLFEPADNPQRDNIFQDAFAEASMYYHTARAYQFFRGLRQEPEARVVKDAMPFGIRANVQLVKGLIDGDFSGLSDPNLPLEPLSNAFFSPGGPSNIIGKLFDVPGGGIYFGQSDTTDYGYDGDVIYHEFGHAIVHATLELGGPIVDKYGLSFAESAMNEGLADYFSSAIAGDPELGEYASRDDAGGGPGPAIRSLENQDTCENGIVGESHRDSEFFSGALWQARKVLPEPKRTEYDRALYKAMLATPPLQTARYQDIGNVFLKRLQEDLPEGALALKAALQARGILPECIRAIVYKGVPVEPADFPGYYSGGTTVIDSEEVPGVMQIKKAIDPEAKKLSVAFGFQTLTGAPYGGHVLVRWISAANGDTPIQWVRGSKGFVSNADVSVPYPDTDAFVALDVPAGTTGAYLQVSNRGEEDAYYSYIQLVTDTENRPVRVDAGVPEAGAKDADISAAPRPADAGMDAALLPAPPLPPLAGGGCECHVSSVQGSGATLAQLGLSVLLAARVLRKRARCPKDQ